MLLRRCVRSLQHMGSHVNAVCSILKSLCGYTCTRMTLSMFKESCGCLWLNLVRSAPYERSCSFRTDTGVEKGYWDASSGDFVLPSSQLLCLTVSICSFGLLHRIPTPPEDREPGTTPPELHEGAEDFEEQQLFVPAEVPQPVPVSEEDHYPEWNQSFHSVHSGHSHYEEHSDPLKPSFYGNGHHGHTVHIHDHDHHDSDRGHVYEHEEYDGGSSEDSSPLTTSMPLRLPSNAPISHPHSNTHVGFGIPRNMTPTQTRPLPGLRNGSGTYTNGDSRP